MLLSAAAPLRAQTVTAGDSIVTMEDLRNESLPLIVINTVGGEEPAFDKAETPEGCWGSGITNVTKVPGRMYIILGADTLFDSGEYVENKSGMTIKVRGNSSAYSSKKPYKIKLQKKADLLLRGNDDVYKDKEWALIRDERDLISHMTGFRVNRLMDFSWVPSYQYANVVMNDRYRGILVLVEQLKRNPSCRIDVDEDTGYIFEYDPYWWNEDLYFESSFRLNYTLKYPDEDDVSREQLDYIQDVAGQMEASLDDGTYSEHIDVATFAAWCLGHDILGTYDAAGSNMFLTKYDDTAGSKVCMSTMWDFDTIEETPGEWAVVHDWDCFFYQKLFGSENPEFSRKYTRLWDEKKDYVTERIIAELDSFQYTPLAAALDFYSPLDKKISYLSYGTISEQIEAGKEWFRERKEWLEEAVGEIKETGIGELLLPDSGDFVYDLQGRRVSVPVRGVYIRGGRKYVVR